MVLLFAACNIIITIILVAPTEILSALNLSEQILSFLN